MGAGRAGLLLVDPHAVTRDGIRALLARREDLEIVGEADDGHRAIELAERLRPRVVVTELLLPGLAGFEVVRRIAQSGSSRVLVLSAWGDRLSVERALRAGASGYMPKSGDAPELLRALDRLLEGRRYLSPAVADHVVESIAHGPGNPASRQSPLTGRERDVLQLIAEGLSSREIALQLHVSRATVDSHRAKLMEKLGIHKMSGLVRWAIREQLIDP